MVLQRTKLCVIAFLILQLVAACVSAPTSPPTPPPSPTPGPVDLVMAFQDAVNRGAIDEAVALFHDDPAGLGINPPFDWLPNLALTDVRDVTEFQVGLGLKLALTGCQLEGNAVNCQMLLNSDCIKIIVPGGLPGTARIKFLDGKINLLTTTVPDGDAARKWGDTMFSDFKGWLYENRADELIKLNSPPAAGATWRQQGELSGKVCADWAAAKK